MIASKGYPASGPVGLPIAGLETAAAVEGVLVFHSGTRLSSGGTQVITAGGRVLTIVGTGNTFEEAIERAYTGVGKIRFDGMHYRTDIGRKAVHV